MDINKIKFTDKVREVFSLSDQKAKKSKHQYIDSFHLLLTILDTQCLGKKLLESSKFDLNKLKDICDKEIDLLPVVTNINNKTEITSDLYNILKNSESEYLRLRDTYLATDILTVQIIASERFKRNNQNDDFDITLLKENLSSSRQESNIIHSSDEDTQNSLSEYLIDITKQAEEGKLDPVIGRDTEIRRTIQVLQRRTKNNPVLIGEPGVGKTAIIEGLAQRIINNEVPSGLKDKSIMQLDLAALLAGSKFRGDLKRD